MKLSNLHVMNFRSIVDSGDITIESFQVLVGENNVGKSNLLRAIEIFLTPGKVGLDKNCFFCTSEPIVITATFIDLSTQERKDLRKYLLGNKLIVEKRISCEELSDGKLAISAEYHGYESNPTDWWLSTKKVNQEKGSRPDWKQIAEDQGILRYMQDENGRVNKATYEKGLRKLLEERDDIQYDDPEPGKTQALGLQAFLVSRLPEFYLLPAVTDYSSEINRRSTSTIFRRLMGVLADRILRTDPRYTEVESAIQRLVELLNPADALSGESSKQRRLGTLENVEKVLLEKVARLMPTVQSIQLEVVIDDVKDFFSRGVALRIDDGVPTDVLSKGHGLQRCVVFGLLQALIANTKGTLLDTGSLDVSEAKTIILAIEEPELYIHPQMQRMVYRVLREFSETDQVIFSTHSLSFVDVGEYHCIGVVRKASVVNGTRIHQCGEGVLGTPEEKKGFQFVNSFDLEKNMLFFAKHTILVEGKQDAIALVATGRKLHLFNEFPEEIGFSIVTTDSKEEMPKYQKLLNAFDLPFTIWLELDGNDESDTRNRVILDNVNDNKCVRIPTTLEDVLGHTGHFGSTFKAKKFFEKEDNINDALEEMAKDLFTVS